MQEQLLRKKEYFFLAAKETCEKTNRINKEIDQGEQEDANIKRHIQCSFLMCCYLEPFV